MSAENLLLDTNILVHAVRNNATGQFVKQHYGLLVREPVPFVSVVSDGELRSLIQQFSWGRHNAEQARFYLASFYRLTIDNPAILEAYALIDNLSRSVGVRMGKNDLWIAATAHAFDATLVTTDADFGHLPQNLVRHERVPIQPPI